MKVIDFMVHRSKLCNMTWILIIVILVLMLLCWLLFSPFLLELDTATARARFTWWGIGAASAWYEDGWWIYFRILFFHKKMNLQEIQRRGGNTGRRGKIQRRREIQRRKKSKSPLPIFKIVNCLKTFRVNQWKLGIDTGDYPLNARLYPLNFVPGLQDHLDINFMDRNYCSFKIVNAPWKILYAWLR
jgi:hypothetical protein